ncbi:MAG: hypothetical protein KIS78_06570 [Labilithrix sp.]|nr:hypothetical protein [Labilithrix sp.]MCW5832101.1 hypothetical protein [Labilithrix sp.]
MPEVITEDARCSCRRPRRRASARALLLSGIAVALCACARSPATSTTTVTSGTYDVDPGACICRLAQDEYLSCCRSAMELTCRCTPNGACAMVPSGRTCGKTPPTPIR